MPTLNHFPVYPYIFCSSVKKKSHKGMTPDKQKNKALGIATGKSNELHVIVTKQRTLISSAFSSEPTQRL